MECSDKHVEKLKMLMMFILDQELKSDLAEQISTTSELYEILSQSCQEMIATLDKFEADSKIELKIDDLPFKDKYKTVFDDILKNNGFLPYLISVEEKKAWKLSWSAAGVTMMGAVLLTLGKIFFDKLIRRGTIFNQLFINNFEKVI